MPMLCKCPICGFEGNHGFTQDNGLYLGLYLYHNKQGGGVCRRWEITIMGKDGVIALRRVYKTALECFKATCPESEQRTNWGKARIAQLSGNEKEAKKFYALWEKEKY